MRTNIYSRIIATISGLVGIFLLGYSIIFVGALYLMGEGGSPFQGHGSQEFFWMLFIGIFEVAVSIGLWRRKKWAYIVMSIVALAGVILGATLMVVDRSHIETEDIVISVTFIIMAVLLLLDFNLFFRHDNETIPRPR